MKRFVLSGSLLIAAHILNAQTVLKQNEQAVKDSFFTLTPVEVRAVRAGENTPFSKTNISKSEITSRNLGQDLPFLLNQAPSVVINSDAGNGVGYTGIRIRGTDATRINVTLNGIPYNDAESQGTFFVDLPDFASSAGSIQIQRGVGTSSNGSGAFGGSINISTNEVNNNAYAEINNSFGSFNTFKNTLKAGTGLRKGFISEARLSRISSNGYIDRASSNLKSLYFSTGYIKPKTSLRLNIFSGKEKTYQAWNGISEADLKAGNRAVNYAGTEKPGEPYGNETDNYTQTHYQLFFNQQLSSRIGFNTAFFYTKGKGYYEQYKADEDYAKYGMPNPPSNGSPITSSDMIRQLWLDNNFYGNIFSFQYKYKKFQATLGGAYTRYDGKHFGKVIWAEKGLTSVRNWYDLDAQKNDFNIYLKQQTQVANNWHLFYDLQYRNVTYNIGGFRDNPGLFIANRYNFFNPKAGISFTKNGWKSYVSYSIANKEPNRDDFEAGNNEQPRPEQLHDVELGIERTKGHYNWSATFYYMNYKDQLVLTGKINDVGAYSRSNIDKSYRAGVELQGAYKFSSWLHAGANLTLSRNKVKGFTEYYDDYDNGGQKQNTFSETTISFSPAATGNMTVKIIAVRNTEIGLNGKYVSRQYLDNTGNKNRSLNPYYTQDVKLAYKLSYKSLKEMNIIFQVNNLFNKKYEPNGYTYSYLYGGEITTENFYFPMAGLNFMTAINFRF